MTRFACNASRERIRIPQHRSPERNEDSAMGPIALFDKSFIEMLNIDEAAVFDCLYSSVMCPIFYTEVLADLSKEPPGKRSAERIVGDVAKKTPIMQSMQL